MQPNQNVEANLYVSMVTRSRKNKWTQTWQTAGKIKSLYIYSFLFFSESRNDLRSQKKSFPTRFPSAIW